MAQPQRANSVPTPSREQQVQELVHQLQPKVDAIVRRMAEKWVDTPEAKELGAIEYELRDGGQELAAAVHETGLASRKKRGT